MSKITSPILLDTTGQEINDTLKGIQDVLLAQNTLINDETTAANRVWSSKKITEALTTTETSSGTSIICTPIAATPVEISGNVVADTTIVLTQTNGEKTLTREVYIPVDGFFNWSTGNLETTSGQVVGLMGHSILALKGTNTFSISVGTITAKYHIIGSSNASAPSWDVIHGGNAKEV